MNNNKTGNLIKELRMEKDMTQQQLASKLHVTAAAVSKWETGKGFPDVSILKNLSSELGVSIVELVNGEKEEIQNSDEVIEKVVTEGKKQTRSKWLLNIGVLLLVIIAVFRLFTPEKGLIENDYGFTMQTPFKIVEGSNDNLSYDEQRFNYRSKGASWIGSNPHVEPDTKEISIKEISMSLSEFNEKKESLRSQAKGYYGEVNNFNMYLVYSNVETEHQTYMIYMVSKSNYRSWDIRIRNLSIREVLEVIESIAFEQ